MTWSKKNRSSWAV